jgi:hypothetical protein
VDLPPGEDLEVVLLAPGEVDKPTPKKLRREIRHRDSLRCAVPGCDARQGLQVHHEIARAKGGPTVADNLVLICAPCHTLTHVEVLEAAGSPMTGLTWNRKPMDPSAMIRDADELVSWLTDLEDAFNARLAALAESTHVDGRPQSTHVDPRGRSPWDRAVFRRMEHLVDGLASLGPSRRAARDLVEAAFFQLDEPTDEEVLRYALRDLTARPTTSPSGS